MDSHDLSALGLAVAVLCLTLVLASCGTIQLTTFETRAANGEHAWIAAQAISCDQASDRCGRLHLIKGDACLHLARAGNAPEVNYALAADELEKGLALKPSWKDSAARIRVSEAVCEALKHLHALQSGDAMQLTLVRYENAAKGLYQLAPQSVPAIYYLADHRLAQVQAIMPDMHATSRPPACNRLKRAITRVLSIMETAEHSMPPDWNRYADDYQRLAFALGLAMRDADCR